MHAGKRSLGFSLVELITVMALLAIMSIGTIYYIKDASSGFATVVVRDELASTARFAMQRLAAEVRDALPGSVRTTGACLEFLPVLAATHYLDLPTSTPSGSLKAVPLNPPVGVGGSRAAVPVSGNPYALVSPGPVGPQVMIGGPDVDNEIVVSFAVSHQFPAESPTDRLYFVDDPVSVCVDGTNLWRYTGYGYSAAQPSLASLPGALPGRALLAENLTIGATPFDVLPPTLQRNAVVEVELPLVQGASSLEMATRIQVRNVP